MEKKIIIFCLDCRGRFDVEQSDIIEGEVLECPLCSAEIEVLQESPIRIKLLSEEEDDDTEY